MVPERVAVLEHIAVASLGWLRHSLLHSACHFARLRLCFARFGDVLGCAITHLQLFRSAGNLYEVLASL